MHHGYLQEQFRDFPLFFLPPVVINHPGQISRFSGLIIPFGCGIMWEYFKIARDTYEYKGNR